MPGKFHKQLVLLWILCSPVAYPQLPGEQEANAEDLLYSDEAATLPSEIFETLEERIGHPLNLNTATREQLGESGLFTPFQVHILVEYRDKFGDLYSIYELAGLTGFRVSRLRIIARYLTVKTGMTNSYYRPGKNMILINAGKVFPESIGYGTTSGTLMEPPYTASPLKTSIRIKVNNGKDLSLGMAYEKDAGERFFHGIQPEFVAGYINYRGYRIIRQIILGNFQVHHGLGLVNGAGFLHSLKGFQMNRNSISNLRPYASLNEYKFYRGAACKMELNHVELMMWLSYLQMDLSLGNLPDNIKDADWVDYQRKTGLHRLSGELEGRSLAYRFQSGIQVVTRIKNLSIGAMIGNEFCHLTRKGIDSLKTDLEPALFHNFSFQWQWHRKQVESFGEIAVGNRRSTAILAGFRYNLNDFLNGLLLLHHYGSSYRGSLPSAYASGSVIGTEKGIALQLQAEPGKFFVVDFTAELFRYPEPRFLTEVPSTGFRYTCTFQNGGYGELKWKIRLVRKFWQTTPGTDNTGLRSMISSNLTRMDFRFIYNPISSLQWQSRVVVSLLSESRQAIPGYAAVQQVGINVLKKLKCTMQFVVFNVTDWDNRIYLYEPGLYYSFNFPVYYGKGQKVSAVATLKSGRKLTIAGKVSVITYLNRENTGSAYDMIPGNKKWETGLQLRLNL